MPGVHWSVRDELERFAFLPHWAASALLSARSRETGNERVRPRPHPMAFPTSEGPVRYDYVGAAGLPYPWVLTSPNRPAPDARQRWLFDQVDGDRSVGDLREWWTQRYGAAGFDEALAALAAGRVVIAEPELPAGDADTVRRLRAELVGLASDTELVDLIGKLLGEFASAQPAQRIGVLGQLKQSFAQATSGPVTRRSGEHYADRGVLFEECLSPTHGFTFGPEIARFITDELCRGLRRQAVRRAAADGQGTRDSGRVADRCLRPGVRDPAE